MAVFTEEYQEWQFFAIMFPLVMTFKLKIPLPRDRVHELVIYKARVSCLSRIVGPREPGDGGKR